MSGKGSAPRPIQDFDKYSDNYDLIFGKKNEPVQNNPSSKCALAKDETSIKEKSDSNQ